MAVKILLTSFIVNIIYGKVYCFSYPFTSIGAGGLVVNSKNEVLMIKELRGPYLGWKFPGGAGWFRIFNLQS